MRRADRLFQLVQILRRSRVVTARRIAEQLEISERTVYRDIRDLTLSGVPIRGEAGVGYALAHGFDVPPLMFTEEEIEALVFGVRVVQGYADPALARAADSVLAKVQMVLPDGLRDRTLSRSLLVPAMYLGKPAPNLGALREAIRSRKCVSFAYSDAAGNETRRTVRPLAVAFWGKVWSLASWCEKRKDFRGFRLDRMREVALGTVFVEEEDKSLDAFILHVTREAGSRGAVPAGK
jgi:predicted DNA-binding transcriptional regulator YafY